LLRSRWPEREQPLVHLWRVGRNVNWVELVVEGPPQSFYHGTHDVRRFGLFKLTWLMGHTQEGLSYCGRPIRPITHSVHSRCACSRPSTTRPSVHKARSPCLATIRTTTTAFGVATH
jgi:hypothetical protein